MKIAFITEHQIGRLGDSKTPTAAGASARMRVTLPALGLRKHNIESTILSLHSSNQEDSLFEQLQDARVVVVSKLFSARHLAFLKKIRLANKRIIVDFCDNYFTGGMYKSLYHEIITIADHITVNTEELSKIIKKSGLWSRRIDVIPDQIEGMRQNAELAYKRERISSSMRLLAFGNRNVCVHLQGWLGKLKELSFIRSISLEINTALSEELIDWARNQRMNAPPEFSLTMSQWTEFGMEDAMLRSDFVVIPGSDDEFEFGRAKSANRLVESVWAGKPVIAYGYPAYMEFEGPSVALTKDPIVGYLKLQAAHNDRVSHIKSLQNNMSERFSEVPVSRLWYEAIAFSVKQ